METERGNYDAIFRIRLSNHDVNRGHYKSSEQQVSFLYGTIYMGEVVHQSHCTQEFNCQ